MKDSQSLYEKRRSVLKSIPGFWKTVLLSGHTELPVYFQLEEDQEALAYLEDVWIVRDETEPRVFNLEFVRIFYSCIQHHACSPQEFGLSIPTAFQGEPVLHRLGTQKGVQIHPVGREDGKQDPRCTRYLAAGN